jgi:hypothetical protein
MSYILDALKKIEHEKNKKRSDGKRSITNDLFQERKQPVSGGGLWKIVALIVMASLLAGGGTWFVLQGKSTNTAVIARQSALPHAVPSAPPVVAPPAPMPIQAVAPAVAAPTVLKPAVPAAHANAAADEEDDASASSRSRRSAALVKAQPVVQKQSVQIVPVPADIKLSGIAWQDERGGRRAVINGFLLKEGAVVSGTKITEIQADRVRFSTAGGAFEIRLDAVLPAEVKQ